MFRSSFLVAVIVLTGSRSWAQAPMELIQQLRAEDSRVRIGAAQGLARLGRALPKEAIGPLTLALDDPEGEVAEEAVRALANAAPHSEAAIRGLIKGLTLGPNWQAQLALQKVGRPAVKPIMDVLASAKDVRASDKEIRIHFSLFAILAEMKSDAKDAIPVLERSLKAKDFEQRLFAARAIIAIDPTNKSVAPVLTEALTSREQRIRFVAAEAIARSAFLKNNDALDVLLSIMRDEKTTPGAYDSATVAVAHFGPAGKNALPLLTEHLELWRKFRPEWGVYVAGAVLKIDRENKDARQFLEEHRKVLESVMYPRDRVYVEFAQELLTLIGKRP